MIRRFTIPITALLIFLTIMLGSYKQEAYAGNVPVSFNHWIYGNLNILFHPNFFFHVMPGHSYEYIVQRDDTNSHANKTFLTELFIGPWFNYNITNNLNFKIGVEYYYMGFSPFYDSDFIEYYNHCIEVIPIFTFKVDPITISSRTIFHNVLYTSERDYTNPLTGAPFHTDAKSGYGMLIRELITVSYKVNDLITVSLGNEFFFGCVEYEGLVTTDLNSKGYNENRLIPGITFTNIVPGFSVTANYIFRVSFQVNDSAKFDDGEINRVRHYAQLILTYNFKTYE